ncbi:MAG: nucleotide exchange factor GrpE [Patescibacteria group bacterium]
MDDTNKVQEPEETIADEPAEISGGVEENTELEDCEKNAEDFKNKYLRVLADYQNLERRVRDERSEMIKIAQARIIEEFLPFLDTLHQAEVFIKDPGLKMVMDTFTQKLKDLGVKEVELLNKEFDPNTAEAVDVVEAENDNMVVEVLRRAYEYNGKLLQIGQVKVSRKKE